MKNTVLTGYFQLRSAALFVFLIIFISSSPSAQEIERLVFQLKDGSEIIGTTAFRDTSKQIFVIGTLETGTVKIPFSKVESVKSYQQVMMAPINIEVPIGLDTCRLQLPVLIELKAIGMVAEKFYIGAEFAAAYRFGRFSLGLGVGWWNMKSVSRFPLFVHMKYNFCSPCLSPFVHIHAGTIFDRFTSKNNIDPSLKHIKEPGPKFIGVGVGIDYAIRKWIDLSADIGVRYITIAGDVDAASCNGPVPVFGYTEMYAFYFRLGVAF